MSGLFLSLLLFVGTSHADDSTTTQQPAHAVETRNGTAWRLFRQDRSPFFSIFERGHRITTRPTASPSPAAFQHPVQTASAPNERAGGPPP